jgi:ribosomal protein S27E
MKRLLIILIFFLFFNICAFAQVIVNPDGTHSTVHGKVIVNSDGTHSTVHGKVVVNPDATHSTVHGKVIVNPDGTHSVVHGNIIVNPDGSHSTVINRKKRNTGRKKSWKKGYEWKYPAIRIEQPKSIGGRDRRGGRDCLRVL